MNIKTSSDEINHLKIMNKRLTECLKLSAKYLKYFIQIEEGHGYNMSIEKLELKLYKSLIKQSERGYK